MWLLASRGRPQSLKRFIDAYNKTKASSPIYVRLDTCDLTLEEYKKLNFPKTFNVVIDKRARLGACMKEIFEKFPNEPYYGLLADDLLPITDEWDKKLIEAAGKDNISQFNDLTRKPKNYCHPCIGGNLVRRAGFFGFPYTTHYALELVWKDLTKKDKRFGKYLNDVVIENLHPDFAKSSLDKTYKEAHAVKDEDHKIWLEWRENKFEEFYQKVKDII
jgi:hypothetical protein